MILASRRRAERSALSNGPIIKPGADDRRHAEAREPVAQRSELVVAHRPKPWVVDLENLRAELGRDGDEAFEARAPCGLARGVPRALQAQMIGQAVGVEAEGEGLSARLRLKRFTSRSSKPRIDGDRLLGDHAAVVGGEEQRRPRDLVAEQTSA